MSLSISELVDRAYLNSKNHGFHEQDADGVTDARFGQMIALAHSELSEALEGHRSLKPFLEEARLAGADAATEYGNVQNYAHRLQADNVVEELADVVIRIADMCGTLGFNLQAAIEKKMLKNESRPYKHGKSY